MPAVYLDRRDLTLEYQTGSLLLRAPGQPVQRLPLRQIDALVIRSQTNIDSRVLTHLAEQGTAVLLMDGRAGKRHALVQGYRHGSAARRVAQYQASLDDNFRLGVARSIVSRRILSQHRMLRRALALRPDANHALTRGLRRLRLAHASLRSARTLATLRGQEGAAAAAYFDALARIFPAQCGFEGRNRRPPRDPVNAALSLGYTLLMSDGLRAVLLAGLDPLIGFYHDLAHHRDALACDLIEAHRCRVDHFVWRLFAERTITPEQFETHNGACLMNKTARGHFYRGYEAWANSARNHLLRDARQLVRALALINPEVGSALFDEDPD